MSNFKQNFHLYLIIAFISLLPASANGGIIETSTLLQATTTTDGEIHVSGPIINTGNAAAYDSTVEILMADKRYPAVNLGDNPPGGELGLDYKIAGDDLKPGHYILVVNINFEDLSGRQHNVYRYLPLNYRIDDFDEDNQGISIKLNAPHFNLRSPFRLSEKLELTTYNATGTTIQPTLSFYLPDGITCAQSSIQTMVPPGETKIKEFTIQGDRSAIAGNQIVAIAWWRLNDRIYSIKSESEMVIVHEPILFQWYLAFSTILLSLLVLRAVVKHHRSQRTA
jgi:hypothetical protein